MIIAGLTLRVNHPIMGLLTRSAWMEQAVGS
jgi:hypothetical protein